MSLIKAAAFSDFSFFYKNELHVFRDYDSLRTFHLLQSNFLYRPYLRHKYAKIRAKEYKLEIRFNLPEGYLKGLFHKTPKGKNSRYYAYSMAQEYFYAKLQLEVQLTIDRFLPPAIEYHDRHAKINFLTNKMNQPESPFYNMDNLYGPEPIYKNPKDARDSQVYQVMTMPSTCSCSLKASAPPLRHVAEVHAANEPSLE